MVSNSDVLIVGAGPTGLALAIELQRLGVRHRCIDRSLQPVRFSQALAVQARTLEQFERCGLSDKLIARGMMARRIEFFSDGAHAASMSFNGAPTRYPYVLVIPETATESILEAHLNDLGGRVDRGVELASCADVFDAAEAKLCHSSGKVEEIAARWIVGCDGAHSKVREATGVEFSGETEPHHFWLADVELTGPAVPTDELQLHLHEGNAVFMARWAERTWRVVVALHGTPDAAAPTLVDIQRALDQFVGGGLTAANPAWLAPFQVNERKAERYQVGSLFLAGDAACIHSPVGGQGMNTGLQDAANLGWKLAAVLHGADPQLLQSYDEERGAVGAGVLRFASRGLSAAMTDNLLLQAFRDFLAPHLTQLPIVQKAMLGFISELAIHYRHSSIVRDGVDGGSLRAGDRAPNPDVHFRTRRGGRLLDQLKGGSHLALAVNVANEEAVAHELHGVPLLFLATHPAGSIRAGWIDSDLEEFFGAAPQIALVRPDGYIGFRGLEPDIDALENYARTTGLPLLCSARAA